MSCHHKQAGFTLCYGRPNSVCSPQIKFPPSSRGMLKNWEDPVEGKPRWSGLGPMASHESLREYGTFDLPSSVEQFSRGQWDKF